MTRSSPLSVRVLPGPFGAAEVEGLNPALDAHDESRRDALRRLLTTRGDVCVRLPAPLDDEEARALASMIGDVKEPVGRARDGRALRYADDRQVINSGFVLTNEIRAERGNASLGGDTLRPGLFEFFHTDDSYTQCPAAATVLHAPGHRSARALLRP